MWWVNLYIPSVNIYRSPPVPGPKWGWAWSREVIGHVPFLKGYVLWQKRWCIGKQVQWNKYTLSGGDGAMEER